MTPVRWSVFIDIEGFSAIYKRDKSRAFDILARLVHGIYLIAKNYPTRSDERLWIHQMGDGFIIVSDFPESDLTRPVSIAIALMQYVLFTLGGVTRAGVSSGDFGDIKGCYSSEVRAAMDCGGYVIIPMGKMHTFPVMGDALINSYKLQVNQIKGPLLFVDPILRNLLTSMNLRFLRSKRHVIVDWINSDTAVLNHLFHALNQRRPTQGELKELLINYVSNHNVSDRWRMNAIKMA